MDRDDLIDSVLVRRYQLGDTDALGVLFFRHELTVARTLRHSMTAADDVGDLVQEVFLRAMGGLSGFRGACTFRTWIITITLNAVKSHLTRSSRRFNESLDDGSAAMKCIQNTLTDGQGPEDGLGYLELNQRVQQALQGLSEDSRTSFALRVHCDLSYEDISAIIGCKIGTTRSRIHRAREAIHDSLAGDLQES